jgi:hypothetical protein
MRGLPILGGSSRTTIDLTHPADSLELSGATRRDSAILNALSASLTDRVDQESSAPAGAPELPRLNREESSEQLGDEADKRTSCVVFRVLNFSIFEEIR